METGLLDAIFDLMTTRGSIAGDDTFDGFT
jgi:hypothetical protein